MDWNTIEEILQEALEVDWSKLPEDQDLFIEDLRASVKKGVGPLTCTRSLSGKGARLSIWRQRVRTPSGVSRSLA